MFHDAIENLIHCNSGFCFAWHGVLAGGALLLGIWFAFELWCRPYRDDARIYMNLLRDRALAQEESEREAEVQSDCGAGRHEDESDLDGEEGPLLVAADRARRQRQGNPAVEFEVLSWKTVELVQLASDEAKRTDRDTGRERPADDLTLIEGARLAEKPDIPL